jgi:hypothetical protein
MDFASKESYIQQVIIDHRKSRQNLQAEHDIRQQKNPKGSRYQKINYGDVVR